eukprot:15466397-Alexandrium_andersonii.AAC.1
MGDPGGAISSRCLVREATGAPGDPVGVSGRREPGGPDSRRTAAAAAAKAKETVCRGAADSRPPGETGDSREVRELLKDAPFAGIGRPPAAFSGLAAQPDLGLSLARGQQDRLIGGAALDGAPGLDVGIQPGGEGVDGWSPAGGAVRQPALNLPPGGASQVQEHGRPPPAA